jgi:hypothetical protein
VLPAGVGEFATNGLVASYWGAPHSRTLAPIATWPGYEASWGQFQYATYFGNPSDGSGLTPFAIVNDTAAQTPTQALRIVAEPMPSPLAGNLKYAGGWTAANLTAPVTTPPVGGSLTVQLTSANAVHQGWSVGIGAPQGGVTRPDDPQGVALVGTVTSGGCTVNGMTGQCTGGSTTVTFNNITYTEGGPGVAIPSGTDFQAWTFQPYYSGVLDTNVNQQYGFFVARVRLPAPAPALSPAWWMLETGGVGTNPTNKQLLRSEWDVEEMFANAYGNELNAGNILWNSGLSWGCGLGCPAATNTTQAGATGVYPWPTTGSPSSDYHDYGVLISPGGPSYTLSQTAGVYVVNNNPYQGTTFFVDGNPVPGHIGGPDLTQGSPDKELMLMFQVGAPGTWLDPGSAGMTGPAYMYAQWLRAYQPTTSGC